ncbi:hypothetical protein [Streptomyces guryensis]|uniref:Sigma-like protein n=1 Tax=Streptomyces guryensis TaxID=2886947 RepID=A0A9Q3ZA62_9ACTN|nr:hypothetical protein [Streptomyces guryensis]MCD9880513.1 hypothetical protein [Streptomyces guryensis]
MTDASKKHKISPLENHAGSEEDAPITPAENHAGGTTGGETINPLENHAGSEEA